MMVTITSVFSKVDALPITWKKAVEPPKKRAKQGPGRPRRAQSPAIVVVTSDDEQHELEEEAEDGDCQLAINATSVIFAWRLDSLPYGQQNAAQRLAQ